MPRPRKPEQEGKEVKKRSRNGCWPCKARKVKCGEEKPNCLNCQRQGETCDYSIRLNWDGRSKKKDDGRPGSQTFTLEPPSFARASSDGSTSQLSYNGTPSYSGAQSAPQLSPLQLYEHERAVSPHTSGPFLDQPLPSVHDYHPRLPFPPVEYNQATLPLPQQASWPVSNGSGLFPGMTPFPTLRQTGSPAYPSPADTNLGSPGQVVNAFNTNGHSMQMPPPMPTSNPSLSQDAARSPHNHAKRVRLSPRNESFGRTPSLVQRASSYGPTDSEDVHRPIFNPLTPTYFPPFTPMTPAASSTTSDDRLLQKSISQVSQMDDDRRISVSSLLSDDVEDSKPKGYSESAVEEPPPSSRRGSLFQTMMSYSDTETYGQDRGYPDLDIPKNNDAIATNGSSPSESSDFDSWLNGFDVETAEFGFRLEKRGTVFAKGGYYASPVPIRIPRKLEPLPKTLQENPMNLLYFHHFLNHTARILVPHDCPENPFKTVLPAMAVKNPNLLNLLLAYSASHRARLLSHPEPANRIAVWVRDVFPDLRQSLDNIHNTEVSNANLATAIMLASLEIISPSSFGVSIPWQNHLAVARSIIRQRVGPQSVSRKDPVLYFLTRWLAYLDVLGSLSGRKNDEPLFGANYWMSSNDFENTSTISCAPNSTDEDPEDDEYTIDCLLGFTTRCVSILAQVATLARQCDWQRIDSETGQVNVDWRPSDDVLHQAEHLRKDLEQARDHEQKQCSHHSPVLRKVSLYKNNGLGEKDNYLLTEKDAEESLATNTAFHWAGLVHLLRRVHNLPREHSQVQTAVKELVGIIKRIRPGGSAEACLLFPMFTAGAEAVDAEDRDTVRSRMLNAEGVGMCQIQRARKIVEEVWRTGTCWESLVNGEFLG